MAGWVVYGRRDWVGVGLSGCWGVIWVWDV